jgi:TMEM175 potassium channel family protein
MRGALGRSDDPMGVERVAFFSDAVFAIAITLLVIEITVPEGDLTGPQLTHELGRLGPKLFSFGLSFWVIGRFWISHHLTFQHLKRWDLPMLWINLLLLACIAFLPFPTALLGNHLGLPEAARLYATSVTVTGLASTLLWWYATGKGRLVDEGLDPRLRRSMLLRTLTAPVVFGLSIPLVTVQLPAGSGRIRFAFLLWLSLIPVVRLVVRLVVLERRWPAGRRPTSH